MQVMLSRGAAAAGVEQGRLIACDAVRREGIWLDLVSDFSHVLKA